MKFTVQSDEMQSVLDQLKGVIPQRTATHSQPNARVTVDDNDGLELSCSDTSMLLQGRLELEDVTEGGEVSIPGSNLVQIFAKIPPATTVELEQVTESTVQIKNGRDVWDLAVMPKSAHNVHAYQGPRAMDGKDHSPTVLELPTSILLDLLQRSSFAMSTLNESRHYLNGTLFEVGPEHFRVVATNSIYMAVCTDENYKSETTERIRVVLPQKAIFELQHLCRSATKDDEDEEPAIKLTFEARRLTAERGPFTLTTNYLETTYPQYEQIIPEETDRKFMANTRELEGAVDKAVICAAEVSNAVKIDIEDNVLSLNASNEKGDQAEIEIPVESDMDEFTMLVEGTRFKQILHAIDDENVCLNLPSDTSHFLMEGERRDMKYRYVMARMRLRP